MAESKANRGVSVDRSVITKHLKNIIEEEELDSSTCAKNAQVQKMSALPKITSMKMD